MVTYAFFVSAVMMLITAAGFLLSMNALILGGLTLTVSVIGVIGLFYMASRK